MLNLKTVSTALTSRVCNLSRSDLATDYLTVDGKKEPLLTTVEGPPLNTPSDMCFCDSKF
jgi:hypothetical protein